MKAAILGYGFVGSGAYEITRDFPTGIEVKRVLTRTPRPELPFITQDFSDILNDPEIEIVAEAMGGLHPAYEYVTAAMKAGKHVVSANKQLICHYYEELFALAAEMGVQLRFTPSAGGGIPWLCNLMRVKRCDEVSELSGILNGTTNYILHCMTHEGLPFDQVLADAQRKGYAEADPSADIDGIDALRKCAISASLAFDTIVEEDSLQAFGIRHITKADVDNFRSLGKVCKLLVRAKKYHDGRIAAFVEPTLLSLDAPESAVPLNGNMTTLVGKWIGRLSLMGQGAGKYPTGSSLVQDMIDISEHAAPIKAGKSMVKADNSAEVHPYYIRAEYNFREIKNYIQVEVNGQYCITEPLSVADAHRLAEHIRKSDPAAFFAGIAE